MTTVRMIYTVFGLEYVDHEADVLGMRSLCSFISQEKAEAWVADQFSKSETITTELSRCKNVVILPVLSKLPSVFGGK